MRKIIVLILLLVLFIFLEPTPVFKGCEFINHFVFHFFHANVWHLLGNGVCLWVMKRMNWAASYVVAVLCSFLIVEPTVGMSGIIFSAIGINLGRRSDSVRLGRCAVSAVLFGLLPGVSLVFHLISLLVGFGYGWSIESYRIYRRCRAS